VTGAGPIYAFGPYHLDTQQRLLLRDGKPLPLAPKAILILWALVENHGKLVERGELMSRAWPDDFVEENNLTLNIFALRKALAEGFGAVPVIETIPRRGYRFVPPVQEITEALPTGQPNPQPSARRRLGIVVPAGLVAAAACALWLILPPPVPKIANVSQLTHFGLAEGLATDGAHLFTGQKRGASVSIVQTSVESSDPQPQPLQLPFPNARLLDVSPVRKEMLVAEIDAQGGPPTVWIVPLAKGSPYRLDDVESISARWSPDGERVAYDAPDGIYVVARDGSGARKIAQPGGVVDTWSQDGRLLRFTRTNEATGGQSIWEVGADGKGLRPVLPERRMAHARWGEGQCGGRWTPDGRYFIFREASNSSSSIWVSQESGGLTHRRAAPVRLYAAAFGIRDFTLSPDGKRLLLVGVNETRELVRFDRRLGQWVPLHVAPLATDVRWSADGHSISYNTFPDQSLWRAGDGSAHLQLTFPPMQAFGGVWSPDGRRLAFHSLRPTGPGKIGVVPSAGGRPQILLADAPTGEDSPNWSPDGNRLLFVRYWLDPEGQTTASAMTLYDLKTGEATKLPGTENMGPPAWSPDGRYIAAQSADFHKLLLFDFQSGKWREVSHGGFIHSPLWSRDGSQIVYQDKAEGEEQSMYRVRLPDLAPERIAGRREFLGAEVGRFFLVSLTPDDEPVAVVVHSNADVYSLTVDWP
jgi:DNA-binding winged helix-turn-helix (wHTH) protein/Tol biopolymer transport system component